MALSGNNKDREYLKFREATLDRSKVAVEVENTAPIEVDANFTPTGLKIGLVVTTLSVTDSATALPATAQTGRNAFSVRNLDEVETMYVSTSISVTADRAIGTTAGWEVGPGEDFSLDVTDAITLYAICETGKSVLVKVMEIA